MPWLRPEFPSSDKPEARVARSQLKPEAAAQNRPRPPKSRLQTGKTNKSLDIPDTAPRAIAVRGGRRARPTRAAAPPPAARPQHPTRRCIMVPGVRNVSVACHVSVSVEGLSGAVKLPILAGHIYIYSSCRRAPEKYLKARGKEAGVRTGRSSDATRARVTGCLSSIGQRSRLKPVCFSRRWHSRHLFLVHLQRRRACTRSVPRPYWYA